MATAQDKRIIAQAQRSARSLGVAASWVNSGLPLQLSDDFLFELYILFELILDLQHHYRIKYDPGKGNNKHQFPRKPAKKKTRPRFEIYSKSDDTLLWQICAGTQIADIHGKNRAPDISFQRADSSDKPHYRYIEMIWDAKYRKNSSGNITHQELADFGRWVELLAIKNSHKPRIRFSKLTQLLANCLITNGLPSTEPDAELIRLDIKEVVSFHPDRQFIIRP